MISKRETSKDPYKILNYKLNYVAVFGKMLSFDDCFIVYMDSIENRNCYNVYNGGLMYRNYFWRRFKIRLKWVREPWSISPSTCHMFERLNVCILLEIFRIIMPHVCKNHPEAAQTLPPTLCSPYESFSLFTMWYFFIVFSIHTLSSTGASLTFSVSTSCS